MNKKAQVMENLGKLAVGIATFTIIMVVAFLVMGNTGTQMVGVGAGGCDNSSWVLNTSKDVCCLSGALTCTGANQSQGFSAAYNSTRTLTSAAATVPGWVPLVVIVAIGATILGMIGMFKRS
jgi:hypothetical protein